jgi:hypothetical protein
MNDRELLALAAKAADCGVRWEVDYGCYSVPDERCGPRRWNPLTNDGDALRLAVKLRLKIVFFPKDVAAMLPDIGKSWAEFYESDPYAATRRAIVRAAAALAGPPVA